MKSPDEQGEAHERISRILEIVKGEKMPSAKQKGKKQDKHRKAAANSDRKVDKHRSEQGGDEDDLSPKTKVWMRKSEVSQAPTLNAAAPEFTPSTLTFAPTGTTPSDYGCGAMNGYVDGYEWAPWEMTMSGPPLPEVVPGTREGEFLGLQCIAEMGEWIVFRERKDNAKPFFWNMYTEEKSWDAPAILQELGVADVLQKWSQDLDAFGIEPSPALRNPRARRRERDRHRDRDPKWDPTDDAPPGFA